MYFEEDFLVKISAAITDDTRDYFQRVFNDINSVFKFFEYSLNLKNASDERPSGVLSERGPESSQKRFDGPSKQRQKLVPSKRVFLFPLQSVAWKICSPVSHASRYNYPLPPPSLNPSIPCIAVRVPGPPINRHL